MQDFYATMAWRRMRLRILRRDGYRCRVCGLAVARRGEAHIDHAVPLVERPDLALDPMNLRTLCRSCHSAKTAVYDRRSWAPVCTLEDFDAGG